VPNRKAKARTRNASPSRGPTTGMAYGLRPPFYPSLSIRRVRFELSCGNTMVTALSSPRFAHGC